MLLSLSPLPFFAHSRLYTNHTHIYAHVVLPFLSSLQRSVPTLPQSMYCCNKQTIDPVQYIPAGTIYIYVYIYMHILRSIYFYHRTLSALPHDELPTLEPGTRSRISEKFMAPGHETPHSCQGGVLRAGGRSPRLSDDVCAEPLRLEGSPETRGVPCSGAGPSQNGTYR